jgi:hypothetical protein
MEVTCTAFIFVSAIVGTVAAGGHQKRGLADYASNCKAMNMLGVRWFYDWTLAPRNHCSGVEFVPMIWGRTIHKGGDKLPDDPDKVADMIPTGSKYLLGFNEPDHPEQSNISPTDAVALWHKIVGPVATKLKLATVSPSVSCSSSGKKWLSSFLNSCKGCNVHHVSCHLYECTTGAFDSALQMFKSFNKPIWITEMACPHWETKQYSLASNENIMMHALPKLDNDGTVFRYSWYHLMEYGKLWNGKGQAVSGLTALGQKYKSLAFAEPMASEIEDGSQMTCGNLHDHCATGSCCSGLQCMFRSGRSQCMRHNAEANFTVVV